MRRGDIYRVALDLKARNGRRVESLPQPVLSEVLAKISTIFQ